MVCILSTSHSIPDLLVHHCCIFPWCQIRSSVYSVPFWYQITVMHLHPDLIAAQCLSHWCLTPRKYSTNACILNKITGKVQALRTIRIIDYWRSWRCCWELIQYFIGLYILRDINFLLDCFCHFSDRMCGIITSVPFMFLLSCSCSFSGNL